MPGVIPIYSQDQEPTLESASADGMWLVNDGRTELWIDNDGGVDRLVVTPSAVPCSYGQATTSHHDDEEHRVVSGSRLITRTFPVLRFGGQILVVYDSAAGLSFAAVRRESHAG